MRFGEDLHALPRRPADIHKSKILQFVASTSLAFTVWITVYATSKQKGAPVDPLYIEDTDDWLGTPEPLETCRHQIRMYENEFEALTIKLARALENVQGLVQENDQLKADLKKSQSDVARLHCQTSEQAGQLSRFANIAHQADILFQENQRLLRERRDSEEE